MPNIIKGFNLFFFVLFFSTNAKSQALIANGSNLDFNGPVYSVKEIPFYGGYYVAVGDFTLAGGQSVNNIAFINKNTFQVEPINVISSIDGPIYDIGYGQTYSWPSDFFIYLGGEFTTINGSFRQGACRLGVSVITLGGLNSLSVNGWDPQIDGSVTDIDQRNDTIYFSGAFYQVNNGASANDFRNGIAAFNSSSGADLPLFDLTDPCFSNGWQHDVTLSDSRILLGGGGSFSAKTYDGCDDGTFTNFGSITYLGGAPISNFGGMDIESVSDSIYCGINNPDVNVYELLFQGNGSGYLPNPPPMTMAYTYKEVAAYKDRFYLGRSTVGNITYHPTLVAVGPNGQEWTCPSNILNFIDGEHEHLYVIDNVLFGSIDANFNVLTQPRTGMFAFCLDPEDAKDFTSFDTTICQGDTVTYTIPAAEYADGYEWDFSGNGVHVNYQVLPISTSGETTLPTVDIIFFEDFTPGTLTVTPYSTCGGMTLGGARVYSEPVSIFIGTNPLPNALAGADTTLTCYTPSIDLVGTSDTASVTYAWKEEGTPTFNTINPLNVVDAGNYVLEVKRPNGCRNFDTVTVAIDTLKPTFDPVVPDELGCGDTIYLLGHCNNISDTLSWWQQVGSSDTLWNPGEVTSVGFYNFFTVNLQNGCKDSLNPNVYVDQNTDPPNIQLVGYPGIPSLGVPLDTIDCYNPSFALSAYSDTANTVVNFVDAGLGNPIGPDSTITSPGTYYLLATNNANNCTFNTQFIISSDTIAPVLNFEPFSSLNCSNDSLLLEGSTITLDSTISWTGPGILSGTNPIWVDQSGYYTLSITANGNGCETLDSILVVQDNSIDIISSNDTTVCDSSTVPVSTSYVGTITGINYLWSNGSTSSATSYFSHEDSIAVIEINGDGGCYGIDTIQINTPPYPVFNFESFQPCGTGSTGSIVASPISGWGPFEYSIDDGVTFQTSSTITGLDLGDYVVTVQDSLNCLYNYDVSISQTSAVATPDFLFSTYNSQWDTVVVIDVSNPPADSVFWIYSPEITFIGYDNGNPLIILPDTGAFEITMDAYFGTCLSSLTKQIYVSDIDTTQATLYNSNSIKSVELYPNPNDGTFTVEIEFYKSQNLTLSVNDMLGTVFNQFEFTDELEVVQTIELDPALVNGTYVVRVAAEFDSAFITFILNR